MVNNKRDIFIDTLRGLMLVIMTLDHTPLSTKRLTFSTFGFFSAAMGFIFLSGYVFGMVYSKYLNTPRYLMKKTYKRIWLIYKYHIGSFIIILVLNYLFVTMFNIGPIDNEIALVYKDPGKLIKFLFLLEQPIFFDILPIYIIFLIFSPFVLIGFKKGRAGLILIFSFVIWLTFQTPGPQEFLKIAQLNLNINLGEFNLFAWQFLFIAGLFFGYNKNQDIPIVKYNKQLIWTFSILAVAIFLFRQVGYTLEWNFVETLLYERNNLIAPRLISFFIVAYLAGGISQKIKVKNTNFLAFLGKYSIDVFTFHIPLAFLMFKWATTINGLSFTKQIFVAHCLIVSLIIPAIVRSELRIKTRRHRAGRLLKNMSLFFSFPKDVVYVLSQNMQRK